MNSKHFDGALVPTPCRRVERCPPRAATGNGATTGAIITAEAIMVGGQGPTQDAKSKSVAFEIDRYGVTPEGRPAIVVMAELYPRGRHDAAARLEVDDARVGGVVVCAGR